MKRGVIMIALLLACVGAGSAQTRNSNDLLQTGSGSQEDLSSLGLGTVTFQGASLSTDTGTADTIVRHVAIPSGGGTVNTQVIALHLQNSSAVTCSNQAKCGSHFGGSVDVHATINATGGIIPTSVLPQPDTLDASTGTMTVSSNLSTFSSNFANIEADIIVVPVGAGVTATPIFTSKGPAASMSATGGTLSATPPSGYPNSQNFPTIAPYVVTLSSSTTAMLVTGPSGRVFRGSLWGLGCLLMGFALLMARGAMKRGRLDLRPVYLAGLAMIAWFVAWRSPSYPRIVYANGAAISNQCGGSVGGEEGLLIKHHAAPAHSGPCSTTISLQ